MGKQTSSKQWNIPMLNARKHMQKRDTLGNVSSGYGIIKLQKIYERLYLARIDKISSYMDYKTEVGSQLKAQYDKRTRAM